MLKRYVLDAWALLAWLGGEEPADTQVQALLDFRGSCRIVSEHYQFRRGLLRNGQKIGDREGP